MAQAWLFSILEAQLGKYINGLDDLKTYSIAFWKGDLTLDSLSLKTTAFSFLPFSLLHGSIDTIHVHVPWNALGSKSIQIEIQGIHVLLTTENKSKNTFKIEKRNALERMDCMRKHVDSTLSEKTGFWSSLTQRVIENLQITIRNVNIRYEDQDESCVVQVGWDELRLDTMDKHGLKVFVKQDEGGLLHKCLELCEFKMSWEKCIKKEDFLQERITSEKEIHEIQALLALKKLNETSDTYLIPPMGMICKVIQNETMDFSNLAKWSIDIPLQEIAVHLKQQQFDDMMRLQKSIARRIALDLKKNRPFYSILEDPFEWWKYAILKSTVRKNTTYRWKSIQRACRDKREYIRLYTKSLDTTTGESDVLKCTRQERERLEMFESIFPNEIILILRTKIEHEWKEKREEYDNQGWYNYFFDQNEITQEGRDNILQVVSSTNDDRIISNLLSIKVTLGNGQLFLIDDQCQPLSLLTCDGTFILNLQDENVWQADVLVDGFHLQNDQTIVPRIICSVPKESGVDPVVSLCVQSVDVIDDEKKYKVYLKSRSVNICIDWKWCRAIVSFFNTYHASEAWTYATESIQGWVEENADDFDALLAQRSAFVVSVDLEAPVLFIPETEESSADVLNNRPERGSMMVVHLGHFHVSNASTSTDSSDDEKWVVDMQRLQLQLAWEEDLDQHLNSLRPTANIVPLLGDFSVILNIKVDTTIAATGVVPTLEITLSDQSIHRLAKLHASWSNVVQKMSSEFEITSNSPKRTLLVETISEMKLSKTPIIKSSPLKCKSDDTIVPSWTFNLQVDCITIDLNYAESKHQEICHVQLRTVQFHTRLYSTYVSLRADLKQMNILDKHHSETSPYYDLVSSSSFSKDSLITIDLIAHFDTCLNDENQDQYVLDFMFNVLHVQWNPSTMAILWKLVQGKSLIMLLFLITHNKLHILC